MYRIVAWLRKLIVRHYAVASGFGPCLVWDLWWRWNLDTFFSGYFIFPPSVLFHQFLYTYIFTSVVSQPSMSTLSELLPAHISGFVLHFFNLLFPSWCQPVSCVFSLHCLILLFLRATVWLLKNIHNPSYFVVC